MKACFPSRLSNPSAEIRKIKVFKHVDPLLGEIQCLQSRTAAEWLECLNSQRVFNWSAGWDGDAEQAQGWRRTWALGFHPLQAPHSWVAFSIFQQGINCKWRKRAFKKNYGEGNGRGPSCFYLICISQNKDPVNLLRITALAFSSPGDTLNNEMREYIAQSQAVMLFVQHIGADVCVPGRLLSGELVQGGGHGNQRIHAFELKWKARSEDITSAFLIATDKLSAPASIDLDSLASQAVPACKSSLQARHLLPPHGQPSGSWLCFA